MKIHVIQEAGLEQEILDQMARVLQAQQGPLSFFFYPQPVEPVASLTNDLDLAWEGSSSIVEERVSYAAWEELFCTCEAFRLEWKIPDLDFVVFLTPRPNLLNWFSAFEDHANNIFIHAGEWEEYLQCSPVYPLTYLVMSQVLQKTLYQTEAVIMEHAHPTSIGCFLDFCLDKRQIIFKLRTADICPVCQDYIRKSGIRVDLVQQALSLFEAVRKEMLFRQRFNSELVPGKIHITRSHQILLLEYGKELKLSPVEKTLFFFFLKHKEGIVLNERRDHLEELLQMYQQLDIRVGNESIEETRDRQLKTILKLTDPLENAMSEYFSKINRKIRGKLGEELAKPYVFPDSEGGVKRLLLDRSLVSCDSGIL